MSDNTIIVLNSPDTALMQNDKSSGVCHALQLDASSLIQTIIQMLGLTIVFHIKSASRVFHCKSIFLIKSEQILVRTQVGSEFCRRKILLSN